MSDAYNFQAYGGSSRLMFPEIMGWNHHQHQHQNYGLSFQGNQEEKELFHHDLPPPAHEWYGSASASGMLNRGIISSYDMDCSGSEHLRWLSDVTFGIQGGGKLTAQEIMDAKAVAASKSHSEAERRRRERINSHLAKLRTLLPSTTKTDKASLLAEVIQQVKELKRQTSIIAESSPLPTETDQLIVDNEADEDGRFVIKASICCQDRNDLLPDLIKTLKALRLTTLKAEIITLGGRVKNILFITGDDQESSWESDIQYCVSSIQEALRAVMERSNADHESSPGSVKRQRTNINMTGCR